MQFIEKREQSIPRGHCWCPGTEAVLPLCQTPGQGQTYFGKAWLLPHHCHLQRGKDKRQFTAPVDITDYSSKVSSFFQPYLRRAMRCRFCFSAVAAAVTGWLKTDRIFHPGQEVEHSTV